MFGVGFDGSGQAEQVTLVAARRSCDPRQCGGSAREGPGLVENHHIQLAGTFECEPVLDEKTVLSPN